MGHRDRAAATVHRLSPEGERTFPELADAWRAQAEVIDGFLEGKGDR